METGAYADAGPRVTQKAGYRCFGPYRIPHMKTDALHGLHQHRAGRRLSRLRHLASDLGV